MAFAFRYRAMFFCTGSEAAGAKLPAGKAVEEQRLKPSRPVTIYLRESKATAATPL